MVLLLIFIIGLTLFIIIVNAVKIGVREALFEFKDEIVKEFGLKNMIDRQSGVSNKDTGEAEDAPADSGQADINRRDIE